IKARWTVARPLIGLGHVRIASAEAAVMVIELTGQRDVHGAKIITEIVASERRVPQIGTGLQDVVGPGGAGLESVVAPAEGGDVAGAGRSSFAERHAVVVVAGDGRPGAPRVDTAWAAPIALVLEPVGDLITLHVDVLAIVDDRNH